MYMQFTISNYSGEHILREAICLRDTTSKKDIELAAKKLRKIWTDAKCELTSAHLTSEGFSCFYDFFSFDIPENVVVNSIFQLIVTTGNQFTINDI